VDAKKGEDFWGVTMTQPKRERVFIPIESELGERLEWFVRLRWLAGAGILAGTGLVDILTDQFDLTLGPLYLIGATVIAYNLIFYLIRTNSESPVDSLNRSIFLQIVLDWMVLIGVVHYSGGVLSPAAPAFVFHIIICAILLSRKACFLMSGFAAALLGALVLVEEMGIWEPVFKFQTIMKPSQVEISGFYVWIVLVVVFLVTAFLVTSITARLRAEEEALFNSERALEKANDEMEKLYELGQIVHSTLDFKETLGLIAENAAKLLNMKACFIRLFDESGKKLFIGGSYGLSQDYINKGPVEVEKSKIDSETLAGGVVQVLEVAEDPRFQYREEAKREGLRSVLCVPVSARSRVMGVIRVYSDRPHHFSESEQRLLLNLANLGATAIENARSYSDLQSLIEQRVWFARMTHHQLRTPLAAVRAILDALPYAGRLNEKQEELVVRGRTRVQDSFDIIRDLLDLAAAQRSVQDQKPEIVIFQNAVEKAIESAHEHAKLRGIQFSIEFPKKQILVKSNAADLDRIFSNLLENGIKYTPAGGEVRFRLSPEDHKLVARIQDTGIGIAKEEQERVFEGFYRTQEAKATGEIGTGLGLSIVKRLVERWNWKLEMESEPGQGTIIRVIIPDFEEAEEAHEI
jgi:signal transduction histidine kinase